eukprot:3793178-Pleurochrysis_carterae.AAC.1
MSPPYQYRSSTYTYIYLCKYMSDELLGRGEEDTFRGRYPTYLWAKGNVTVHSSFSTRAPCRGLR